MLNSSFSLTPPNKKITLLLWLLLIVLLIAYLLSQAHIRSDMSFFLSDEVNDDEKIIQYVMSDGEANRLIFIQLFNSGTESSALTLAHLNKEVRQSLENSGQFILIENGDQGKSLQFEKQLYDYRYLISSEVNQLNALFSIQSLKKHFDSLAERLQMMVSKQEQTRITQDPLSVWSHYLKSLQKTPLHIKNGVWFNKKNYTILLLKTKENGLDLEAQKKNIQLIEEHLEQLLPNNVSYDISGMAVIALDNSKKITFQIKVISSIASIILALFLYSIFRSIKLLILVSLPLLFAIIVGACVVNLIYGYIHGIALAFGITIIGVAVDYPIHFFLNLQKDNSLSSELQYNQQVILSIWPKIKLGLITTLIGFSAIIFSGFSGLNQLGIFAISGLISAALMTRYLLPLFSYKNKNENENENENKNILQSMSFWLKPIQFRTQCFYRTIILLVIAMAVIHISLSEKLWENDLSQLSPVAKELKKKDFLLRKSLNLPELRYLVVISAMSQEQVLQQSEELTPYLEDLIKEGLISYYDTSSRYIPSIKTQTERQKLLPDTLNLQENLKAALIDSPFNSELFTPFIKGVNNNKHASPLTMEQLTHSLISGKIQSLLFQDKFSKKWHGLVFLSGVKSEFISDVFNNKISPNLDHIKLIDIKKHSNQLIEEYRIEAVNWFFIGSVFILMFLFFYTKKLKSLPALLIPFSGAVILTVSIILLLGYSLSIFHLVTLLLVVGLGIDYSIFIQSNIGDSSLADKESESIKIQQINTFSVLVCSISSFIMFFSLSLSSIPVLKAIGLTASIGTTMALLLTLLISKPCKH